MQWVRLGDVCTVTQRCWLTSIIERLKRVRVDCCMITHIQCFSTNKRNRIYSSPLNHHRHPCHSRDDSPGCIPFIHPPLPCLASTSIAQRTMPRSIISQTHSTPMLVDLIQINQQSFFFILYFWIPHGWIFKWVTPDSIRNLTWSHSTCGLQGNPHVGLLGAMIAGLTPLIWLSAFRFVYAFNSAYTAPGMTFALIYFIAETAFATQPHLFFGRYIHLLRPSLCSIVCIIWFYAMALDSDVYYRFPELCLSLTLVNVPAPAEWALFFILNFLLATTWC